MTNATATIKAERQKTRRALEAARAASDDARAACAFGTGSYEALVAAGRAEMAATRAWCDTWRPGSDAYVDPTTPKETESMNDQTATTNAADRVEAFLDDWDTEYPFDVTGILADIPARYTNGLTPTRELTVADLRQVVAERKQLAARVAELEAVGPEAAADIKAADALARYKAARYCPDCGNPKTSLAHGTRCLSALKETR